MTHHKGFLGLGALVCALALGTACNKKGTSPPGSTGNTGGSAAGTDGSGTSGASATSGGSGTGGGSATSGGSGKGGSGTSGSTGNAGSGTGGTGSGTGGTSSGTGGAAGSSSTACPGAPGCPMCPGTAANKKTGTCEAQANGVYALQVTVDAWWNETSDPTFGTLVSAGRGKVVIYLKGELSGVCEDGTGGMGVMRACGAVLPPFVNDILCEAYQLKFPDALWDSDKMPTFMTTSTTTGFNPGDTLSIAEATGLVGIDVMNPTGAWPASSGSVTCSAGTADKCFPDHDGDGKPGVTVDINIGGTDPDVTCSSGAHPTFSGAPINTLGAALGGARGVKLYLGIRNALSGGGKINDGCVTGGGESTASTIDSHVIGCFTDASAACAMSEWQFVDTNSPVYKVLKSGEKPGVSTVPDQSASMGTQGKVVRLADPGATVSCTDIRNAFK